MVHSIHELISIIIQSIDYKNSERIIDFKKTILQSKLASEICA